MEDIYSDLDNYEHVNDAEKIQTENAEFRYKIEVVSDELARLREDYDKLQTEYKKLEINFSSLLKTAKSEIERKTQLITNLNTEKDQLILRFLSTNRYPLPRGSYNTKTNDDKCEKTSTENNLPEKKEVIKITNEKTDRSSEKAKTMLDYKKNKNHSETDCHINNTSKVSNTGKDADKNRKPIMIRQKSLSDMRNVCQTPKLSPDNDSINEHDQNYDKKSYVDSHYSKKYSYISSKKYSEKSHKEEFRPPSPRENRYFRSRYETRERYTNQKYRQREDWIDSRSKERSPNPRRHKYDSREENRKSRRDRIDLPHSPPLRGKQRHKSRDRQCDEYHTERDHDFYYENFEREEEFNVLHEKRYQEHYEAHNRKHKLDDECHEFPKSKRRKNDTESHSPKSSDIKAIASHMIPEQLTHEYSHILQSPDDRQDEDLLPLKESTVAQSEKVGKLPDPRLSSCKYIQTTDYNNRIHLRTYIGRNIELKRLHYVDNDPADAFYFSPKKPYESVDDYAEEIYADLDQVSNTSFELGEILDHSELSDLSDNKFTENGVQEDRVQSKVHTNVLKAKKSETSQEKFDRQLVEDDLELSEDTCDNNDYKPESKKLENKKTKKKLSKSNKNKKLAVPKMNKTLKEGRRENVVEEKSGNIENVIHPADNTSTTTFSITHTDTKCTERLQNTLITLEDLNITSSSHKIDNKSLNEQHNKADLIINSVNEKIDTSSDTSFNLINVCKLTKDDNDMKIDKQHEISHKTDNKSLNKQHDKTDLIINSANEKINTALDTSFNLVNVCKLNKNDNDMKIDEQHEISHKIDNKLLNEQHDKTDIIINSANEKIDTALDTTFNLVNDMKIDKQHEISNREPFQPVNTEPDVPDVRIFVRRKRTIRKK